MKNPLSQFPRVRITYEADHESSNGAKELPMVVGVLANLKGTRSKENFIPLSERKVLALNDENLFHKIKPLIKIAVKNELTPESAAMLDIQLEFKSLHDFEPGHIVQNFKPFAELLSFRMRAQEFKKSYWDKTLFYKIINSIIKNNETFDNPDLFNEDLDTSDEKTQQYCLSFRDLYCELWNPANIHKAKQKEAEISLFFSSNPSPKQIFEWRKNGHEHDVLYKITGDKILNSEIIFEHHLALQISTFIKNCPWVYKKNGVFLKELLLERAVSLWVANIDLMIKSQIHHILHHPEFQALEASWLGLDRLAKTVAQYDEYNTLKVKIFDLSWEELSHDITRASDIERSEIFKRIYYDEFDMPGGEPYSLLIGHYSVDAKPQTIYTLRGMSKLAAAAFCPFVVNTSPTLFGVNSFTEFSPLINFKEIFLAPEYRQWNQFRKELDTRFLGFLLPEQIMRLPYTRESETHGFPYPYEEIIETERDYLWGGCVFSFACVALKSFALTGWYELMRGHDSANPASGIVSDFFAFPDKKSKEEKQHSLQSSKEIFDWYIKKQFSMGSLRAGPFMQAKTPQSLFNIKITESMEIQLNELGFICLIPNIKHDFGVFYHYPSFHLSSEYKNEKENEKTDADISSSLHYVMCASRFAHYIKVIGRDKVGSFASAHQLEVFLNKWLLKYTNEFREESSSIVSKQSDRSISPLSNSKIEVIENPLRPSFYLLNIYLVPRFQTEKILSSIKFISDIRKNNHS